MNEGNDLTPVRRLRGPVEKAGAGAKRIQSAIVADALALATRRESTPVGSKFRIGQYDWCEPDYRQILIWAEALSLRPEEVIERLLKGRKPPWETRVERGKLAAIHWDFDLLPLREFELPECLETSSLSFHTCSDRRPRLRVSSLCLPELRNLDFGKQGAVAEDCDLSGFPNLGMLVCANSDIAELDLSKVPQLSYLDCAGNRLSQLDLSHTPNLRWGLRCPRNQITELRLSKHPHLLVLDCSENHLSRLDVSGLPSLIHLNCEKNEIRELDLSNVVQLLTLECSSNALRVLDVRHLHRLYGLRYDVGKTRLVQRPDQHF